MNQSSNIWDWNRFGRLIALKFKLEKLSLIRQLIVIMVITFTILMLVAPSSDNSPDATVGWLLGFVIMTLIGLFIVLWVCITYASRAFSAFKKRESGWLPVLLPASRIEKYVSNCLISTLIVPILFLIAFALPVFIIIMTHDKISFDVFNEYNIVLPNEVREHITEYKTVYILYGVSTVLYWFLGNVMFFMSSAIWPRHPIIMGCIISSVSFVFANYVSAVLLDSDELNSAMDVSQLMDHFTMAAWGSIITQVVMIVLFLVVGWFVYRRRTVV